MSPRSDNFVKLILGQEKISNRFHPLELITDKGNFSILIKCSDSLLKKEVALKFFDPSQKNDEYRLRCFHREAKILERFKGQDNIIELIEGLSSHEILLKDSVSGAELSFNYEYIVLELAESDIQEYIYNGEEDALKKLECFRELCKAVNRIHRQNTVHRDLKPDNFVICDGDVKLSDLGTAIVLNESNPILSEYFSPVGHKGYWAPELFCEIGIRDINTFKADIFSLGAILFEMFTKTMLTAKIYNQKFIQELLGLRVLMSHINKSERVKFFNENIDSVVSSLRLPDIFAFNNFVPNSIKNNLNKLYKEIANLNYLKRLDDFQSLYRQIEICRIILKNEQKEQQRRKFKKL